MHLIDGGHISRPASPPKPPAPPPPPPPPKRVQDAPVRSSGGTTPDAIERSQQAAKQPLADAASNTQQKVTQAVHANQSLASFEQLPPAQRKQLRGEIETARSEANRANVEVQHAIAEELDVARQTLSPAHYDDYVNGLERDFEGNPDEREVIRKALAKNVATAGAADTPADPTLAEIKQKAQQLRDAEATYAQAVNASKNLPPHVRELQTSSAKTNLDAKRSALEQLIRADLSDAARKPADNPMQTPLAKRIQDILALDPANGTLSALVSSIGSTAPAERATNTAAERVESAEQRLADAQYAQSIGAYYAPDVIDRAQAELDTAKQELHNAIVQELSAKVANNSVPAQYLGGDVTAYYANQIADRIGLNPTTQVSIESAAAAQRVLSAAATGDPERAREAFKTFASDLPPDVMKLLMGNPQIQRLTNEIAESAATELEQLYQESEYERHKVSDRLAELTKGLPPDVAAAIIRESMPTIEKLVDETLIGGGYAYPQAIWHALADSIGAAQGTPSGEALTSDFAAMVQNRIANMEGYLQDDAAASVAYDLGMAIGQGADASLSVELARRYSSVLEVDAMTGEEISGLFLSHASDGLERLESTIKSANEDYAKASEELAWILNGPARYATAEEKQAIVEDYRSKHPDLAAAEARVNELGAAAVKNANALVALPPELRGSPYAEYVQEKAAHFLSDKNVIFAMTVSPDAQKVVSDLLERSDLGEDTLLNHLSDLTTWIEEPKSFVENMGGLVTKAIAGKALEALGPDGTDIAAAGRQLDRLNEYADFLGIDKETMSQVVDQFKIAADPDASIDARKAALASVNEKLNGVKDGAFDISTSLGKTFRGVGVLLSFVGAGKSISDAIDDPNGQNVVSGIVASAGFAHDTAEFASAFMKTADWTDSWWFKGSGKALGVVGTFLGGLSVLQSLADGEFADAGFAAAGVGGGVLLMASSSVLWTGVGAFLVIGSFVGKEIYDRVTDDEHENGTTEAALRQMGFDAEAAKILRNQDDDLNSPVPVLMALAESNGIDLKDEVQRQGFIDYINSLDKESLDRLVHAAHGVDPKDDGTYPETAANDSYVINGAPKPPYGRGGYIDRNPHSLTALEAWMQQNGFKVPPTL